MPYASVERRREANRAWHREIQPDGRCEATTAKGTRCAFRGWCDGLCGRVLCNLHANREPR